MNPEKDLLKEIENLKEEIERQKEINSEMRSVMILANQYITNNLHYILSNGGWGMDDKDKAKIFDLMDKLSGKTRTAKTRV